MKLFKTTNTKIKELGFIIIKENNYGVHYERFNEEDNYTQCVDIMHKKSGKHIIQSYDKTLSDIYTSTVVGLTGYEMHLFLKKMKQIKLYTQKP